MPNPIFFAACLLAICLPIISVQLPRTTLYTRLRSRNVETRSARCETTATSRTTTGPADGTAPPPPSPPQHESPQHQSEYKWETQCRRKQEEEDPPTEQLRRRHGATRQRKEEAQGFDGTYSGAAEGEGEGLVSGVVNPGRKPWDPPFPRRENVEVGSWRILPPAPGRAGRIESRVETSVADVDGKDETELGVSRSMVRDDGGEERRERPNPMEKSKTMTVVWIGVAVLALSLFLVAFAVLIAHCLAWFLVYKTEARLGEARRGIMTSGDMRLCLCAA